MVLRDGTTGDELGVLRQLAIQLDEVVDGRWRCEDDALEMVEIHTANILGEHIVVGNDAINVEPQFLQSQRNGLRRKG